MNITVMLHSLRIAVDTAETSYCLIGTCEHVKHVAYWVQHRHWVQHSTSVGDGDGGRG